MSLRKLCNFHFELGSKSFSKQIKGPSPYPSPFPIPLYATTQRAGLMNFIQHFPASPN